MNKTTTGQYIYKLAQKLFPICRSITGNGIRQSLEIIKQELPSLKIAEIPSGTKCFDWIVPQEWNIKDSYIITPDGSKIADFKNNNLHVVHGSIPIDKVVSLEELQNHLFSVDSDPDAIPYVTSFYEKNWGFCLEDSVRKNLTPGNYKIKIDSSISNGHLNYAELIIPGKLKQEIFISTYICHPSMGNNELSGPTVVTYLAKWLQELKTRKYTYRIIFVPETIGSIAYLSKNFLQMKQNIVAGYNVTCVGDNNTYSYLPSRAEDSLSDKIAVHVLKHIFPSYKSYSFLERGSDERQYCSPGIDLPIASIMRSKYHEYPEYHTSKDDMNFISPDGLHGSYEAIQKCLICLENNCIPKITVLGEPQLGKKNLYPNIGQRGSTNNISDMLNLLAYADGKRSLLEIAEKINTKMWDLFEIIQILKDHKLIELLENKEI